MQSPPNPLSSILGASGSFSGRPSFTAGGDAPGPVGRAAPRRSRRADVDGDGRGNALLMATPHEILT
jgi:hypothetical protein